MNICPLMLKCSERGLNKMKSGISLNERIKDLHNNNHMHLDDVTIATGIPKQTHGNYEKDDYPVPHHIVIQLAEYNGVSTDYLLGLTDSPASVHTPVSDLHLSLLPESRKTKPIPGSCRRSLKVTHLCNSL